MLAPSKNGTNKRRRARRSDPYLYFEAPKPKEEIGRFDRFFDRQCTVSARKTGPKLGKKAGKRRAVHRMFARPNDRILHQVASDDSMIVRATEGIPAISQGRRPYYNY
jgi:hypothetical protein